MLKIGKCTAQIFAADTLQLVLQAWGGDGMSLFLGI